MKVKRSRVDWRLCHLQYDTIICTIEETILDENRVIHLEHTIGSVSVSCLVQFVITTRFIRIQILNLRVVQYFPCTVYCQNKSALVLMLLPVKYLNCSSKFKYALLVGDGNGTMH